LFSKKVVDADYILCIDTYCGFTISVLSKLDGKRLVFVPNDCLLPFGLQLVTQRSRILGILTVTYAALVEFITSKLADLILVHSRKMMYVFQSYYGVRGNICVCHSGIEARRTGKKRTDVRNELGIAQGDLVVLFLGSGAWLPNQLAIEYIQKTLAPFLAVEKSEALLMIVGKGTERFRNSITTNNLMIVGDIPDNSAYLEAADLGIAPMIVMGGESTKVIAYLCAGLPVVATNKAAETVEPQVGLFVSDIEHFHIAVSRLLKEKANLNLADRIASESLRYYSWEAIGAETAKRILALEI
jgi:glycosyltransferase involved in cell wall biosynthesis